MSRLVDAYFALLKLLIALLLAAMVVLVFGNVVLRYGFNSGITLSEEVSRWMFVWLTFLGAIVALREHGHLGVDSLVRRLPLWGKKLCFVGELRPDALRHHPAADRQLAAEPDQLGCRRPRLRPLGRLLLRRRAGVRGVDHPDPAGRPLSRTQRPGERGRARRHPRIRRGGHRRDPAPPSGERGARSTALPSPSVPEARRDHPRLRRLAARHHGDRHADRVRAAASPAWR